MDEEYKKLDTEKEIEKLSIWKLSDTTKKFDGYDLKTLPSPTPENMLILFNKINELICVIDELKRIK